ncbi:prepilin-type N-terminal cleavage/methylation domain-containing protein [Anoxynatronum sibiricum]|uniref:Prepilin-type N-terminal cleavage/methylation domain-containing protein n=1 Tax=Anoxynatronum sibiricum TaxID=210623 RepID=A0ABU9VQ49_9CLOT
MIDYKTGNYHQRGYTLLELLLVLAILSLLMSIAFPDIASLRQQAQLRTTASELESALQLARQLSADECREYVVELTDEQFHVRENRLSSPLIFKQVLPPGITRNQASIQRITYNRHGLTGYGLFTLENRRGQLIDIEVHIGTGRVIVSDLYE